MYSQHRYKCGKQITLRIAVVLFAWAFSAAAQDINIQMPNQAGFDEVTNLINEGSILRERLAYAREQNSEQSVIDGFAAQYANARNEAIQRAIEVFNITVPNGLAEGSPAFDPNEQGDGRSSHSTNRVTIGESAFHNAADPSSVWLALTIGHEFVHVAQGQRPSNEPGPAPGQDRYEFIDQLSPTQMSRYDAWKDAEKSISEYESYSWELGNARALRLDNDQIDDLETRRRGYFDGLTAWDRANVLRGNYSTECPLQEAHDCGAPTLDGTPCERRTRNLDPGFCWQHVGHIPAYRREHAEEDDDHEQDEEDGDGAAPQAETHLCGAPTLDGTPCQRRVRAEGHCWQHR